MASQFTSHSSRPQRFGGLDGLRAVAVCSVLLYHLFPDVLPGGFLGVDVFFVISGFLITSLLVREYDARGSVDLVGFWRRRARRLLPALALVLLVSTSLARLAGGDILVGIGSQFAGAAFFVSNWVFIAGGADYFTRDNPELFRNTWSLAIEEQFYIILPLVLLLVVFKLRSRISRGLPIALLAGASALHMASLSNGGAEATRVYFGSDSHTFGLLIGAAAALMIGNVARRSRPLGIAAQLSLAAVAVAGFALLGWLALGLEEGSSASFEGGFQLATLGALAVVWAVTREGAWIGRMLDVAPLRWIGERSYGLYLWHWPMLVIATSLAGDSAHAGWAIPVATIVATVALAALSYRYIEQPVRRLGLRRSLGLLFRAGGAGFRRRAIALASAAVMVVTVPASAYAIATAPERSSAAAAIARGQAALEAQNTTTDAPSAPADEAAGDTARASQEPSDSAPAKTERSTFDAHSDGDSEGRDAPSRHDAGKKAAHSSRGPEQPAPALSPTGDDMSSIGDSVMLASTLELQDRFPGIAIDAQVSRGLGVGVGIAADQAATGALRPVVVIGLGTNGPVSEDELETLRQAVGGRLLVLVNAYGERDWIPGVNETLAAFADKHRGVVVADWQQAVDGVDGALAGDGIHPNPSGGEIYADAVDDALSALQQPGEAVGYALPRR